MANKKRIATSVAAVATAAALLLGGTFAWQSVNQTALNEASDVINPGGRLHDDFNGSNKDVYVENFADPDNGGKDIFARIRLEEYFEITVNKGTPAEKNEIIVGGEATDENGDLVKTYEVFTNYTSDDTFDAAIADDGTAWWTWTTGGETVYMPTFNLNKDSLQADINGTYAGSDNDETTEEDKYLDYVEYYDGEEKTADATYDADANNIEDNGTTVVEETHYATTTANATIVSMQEWNDMGQPIGEYWVYDEDGWVYWAQAIEPDTATGLLLDGIELNQVMDDSWYYAINVVAQFITADDLGKTDGTGFYDTAKGTVPSAAALELLKTIGVKTEGAMMVNDAAALQDALNEGEDVTIGGEIVTGEPPITEEYPTIDSYFLMHEGGNLSGGTITTTAWTDSTLFVNNENNWPAEGDGANAATVNGTNINAVTSWGVRVQALDAAATLNDMTITGEYGGLIAEYSQSSGETGGDNAIALNNMTITAGSHYPHAGYEWINSAVAAGKGADVVIDGGTYTGTHAIYVLPTDATVTVNGGTFTGELYADADQLTIYGGTFTADPSEYVADGYEAIYDSDSATWTVSEKNVDEDTTPPMVSAEDLHYFDQRFTISDVTDNDFPLTVKMYYLATDAADYESETPMKTIIITKTDDGVEHSEYCEPEDTANLQGVTMVDDTVVIDYNLAPGEHCYLHAVVTDNAGNTATANIEVSAAVGCFVAGTQVQTVNGLVNIENIKVGDQVYSIDLSTGEKVVSTVTWVQGTRYIDATYTIYTGGETVEATYEHPFYVIGKEWVAAEDLAVGDVIKTMDGEAVITNIVYTELDAPVQVYNFTVEGTHNYLISESGLLVHNVAEK